MGKLTRERRQYIKIVENNTTELIINKYYYLYCEELSVLCKKKKNHDRHFWCSSDPGSIVLHLHIWSQYSPLYSQGDEQLTSSYSRGDICFYSIFKSMHLTVLYCITSWYNRSNIVLSFLIKKKPHSQEMNKENW